MDPVDCCQKNKYVINFTLHYMVSKFEVFVNNIMDKVYLTEITGIERLQVIYKQWDRGDTTYSFFFHYGCFIIVINFQYVQILKVLT